MTRPAPPRADAALTPRARAEWLGRLYGASVDVEFRLLNERKKVSLMDIRKDDDGKLDEIVARNCTVHLERIDERDYWMAICSHDGKELHVNFLACKNVTVTLTTQRSPTPREAVAPKQSG